MLGTFSPVYQSTKIRGQHFLLYFPEVPLPCRLSERGGTAALGELSASAPPLGSGGCSAPSAASGRGLEADLPKAGQLPGRAEPSQAGRREPSTCSRGLPAAARDSRGRRRPGAGPARRAPGAAASPGGGGPAPRPSPVGGVLPLEPCRAPGLGLHLCRARRGSPTAGGGGQLQLAGPRLPGVKGVGGK